MEIHREQDLLIRLCRLDFSEKMREEISLLSAVVNDWNRFVWLANEHGISALVYYNLKSFNLAKQIPDKERYILRNSYLQSLSRNAGLSEKYDELKNLLNEKGIETVPLKGMALERSIYGNRGLRQMNDVDLLVDISRSMEAWQYLIMEGYEHNIIKSRRYIDILPFIGKHMPELYKEGVSFELHVSLFGRAGENYNTGSGTAGTEGNGLKPLVHFLYLVRHLYYHESVKGESQLRLYTDLFLMLDKYGGEILNEEMRVLAVSLGLTDVLKNTLHIISVFWNMTCTGISGYEISERQAEKAVKRFRSFLPDPKHNKPGKSKRKVYRERIRDIYGFKRKIIYILGDIFPSVEFMKARYGTAKRPLLVFYYILRMGKLLWLTGL